MNKYDDIPDKLKDGNLSEESDGLDKLIDEALDEYDGKLDMSEETMNVLMNNAIEKYFKTELDDLIRNEIIEDE